MAEQYKAVHKKTGKQYYVIGKDSVGTLLQLKDISTGITVTSNRAYYDIYNPNGDFIDEDGVVHRKAPEKDLTPAQIKKVVKEYKSYIESPFSDGYTAVYLEGKFDMTIDEMAQIYEQYRPKKQKNDKALLKDLAKIVGSESSMLDDTGIVVQVRELLKDNGYV